jgi:hypothetical protein
MVSWNITGDNIMTCLTKRESKGMDWIQLAQDNSHLKVSMNTPMSIFGWIKAENFLTSSMSI